MWKLECEDCGCEFESMCADLATCHECGSRLKEETEELIDEE